MRTSLLKVARDDTSITQKINQIALKQQRKENHRKEELLRNYSMIKASDVFIYALYYHDMYTSLACWKISDMVEQ